MGAGYDGLTKQEKRLIERALCMDQGYVLDFSNRTIDLFFSDKFGIDFYSDSLSFFGDSKAKRLRAIMKSLPDPTVSRILNTLWEYRTTLPQYYKLDDPIDEQEIAKSYHRILDRFRNVSHEPVILKALEKFDESDTLEHLLTSIEHDVRSDRHSAALDRLHTYCQRRFRLLLEESGRSVSEDEPLNSRVGKYAKVLEERGASDISVSILRYSVSVFEKLNGIRNNQSLAHDTDKLLNEKEARFVLDSIGSVLRFVKLINDR
jgi:DNA-binding transcriptional ArsR family regulator